jgi:putative monooxygenase
VIAALPILLLWAQAESARADAAAAVLAKAQPVLHRCVERAGAEDFRQAIGSVTLAVTVGEGGRPARIEARAPSGDPKLIACASEAFRGLEFGAPFVAGDSLELPLRFAGEPNLTVRLEDVAFRPTGAKARGQALITPASAMAEQGSLGHVVVERGGTWRAFVEHGMTLYVVGGEATLEGHKAPIVRGNVILGTAQTGLWFRQRGAEPFEVVFLERPSRNGLPSQKAPRPRKPIALVGVYSAADKPVNVIAGGKGRARVLMTAPLAIGVAVTELALDPGGQVPEHQHAGEAEILFVTRGAGTLRVDGENIPIAAGMAVHLPPAVKHAFQVTSTEPFEAVQFYAPAGPERRFLPGATP